MKRILLLLASLSLTVHASEIGMGFVKMPTYVRYDGGGREIRITDVPFVSSYASPEWTYGAITTPFIPPTDRSWREPTDINLASLYKLSVSGDYFDMVVDVTKAEVPEGYPFTVEQVADAVVKCLKLMYPHDPKSDTKLTVKIKR